MLLLLILFPACCALLAWLVSADRPRRLLLVAASAIECALVGLCWAFPPEPAFDGVLALDALGLLVISITSLLFLAASVYALNYLEAEGEHGPKRDYLQGFHFSNAPEPIFTACLLGFLSSSALVACSQHLGLLWVAIEATTLVTAPAIYFHRHRRSLEATWKYLIICSVGIALALLGNILLNVALTAKPDQNHFIISAFVSNPPVVHPYWFQAAFIFIFIGYGTKMGLAPMHTWLPDAHSEAPSMVSALLSGALLNGSFLGLLRLRQVCLGVGMDDLANDLFIVFGLISMGFAAMFIVGQQNYKRMLAYSSVEHMGILALATGLGAAAGSGPLMHMLGHSLVKASLFLLAGNILARYASTALADIKGLHKTLPRSGGLWLLAVLGITGAPPFVLFNTELRVLFSALRTEHYVIAGLFLTFLAIIFVAMLTAVLRMFAGDPAPTARHGLEKPENPLRFLPSAALLGFAILLGIWTPPPLLRVLEEAAKLIN